MARVDPRNRTRYWQAPRVSGLSLLHADLTAHDYAPHSHEAFVVAVTEAGGAEFNSRGRTDEARESALLVFNPAEPHSGSMARSRRWRYRAFYLDKASTEAVNALVGLDVAAYFTANLFQDRDLIASFLALHRALEGSDDLRAQELLAASFGALIRRHGSQASQIAPAPRDQGRFDTVIAAMNDRHAENLTLGEMSGLVGLTPFQLIGLFKRMGGLTPHAYLTQIRLRAACGHLRRGLALAEAALASGFYDQSALNRHFKRAYAITPRQYLSAHAPAA
jgi:AraC-like DNA-binding protein